MITTSINPIQNLSVCRFSLLHFPSLSQYPNSMATSLNLLSPLSFTTRHSPLSTITPPFFFSSRKLTPISFNYLKLFKTPNKFIPKANDGEADEVGPDGYEMDEEEVEELDNKKDYDLDYDPLAVTAGGNEDEVIAMVDSKSFVSTQGWDSEKTVDYRIDEEEFHKICLLDCDFFIRKPPDSDNNVYDFREMYVTPPDTDVYAIPKILAPIPQKYIRCAMSDYGGYNFREPPIDAPRDPLYKSEKEITKVFLTKHYRNRRFGDPEFVLDFEEIYVIDSKTKSISRAKVVVTVPGGRNRDRKKDLLVIRDHGTSFKIKHVSEKEDPTTVIESEEWAKSRQDMEKHLRKLRDFSVSNWF